MSQQDLKKEITQYLGSIEDEQFLLAIRTLLESKIEKPAYQLSENQLRWVEEAREELSAGRTIPNNKVQEELDKWLSE